MKYYTLEINGQELKCRLTTQNTKKLEEKLGGESLMLMLVKKKVLGAGDKIGRASCRERVLTSV